MKRLLLGLVLLFGAPIFAQTPAGGYVSPASGGGSGPSVVTTLPATCTAGGANSQVGMLINGQMVTFICTATNTFTAQPSTQSDPTLVQRGLVAEYRFLPGETIGSNPDYSGNGNTAAGTDAGGGAAPTMLAATGGINCTRQGALKIPASLNNILSVQIFYNSAGFPGGLLAGNGAAANSSFLGLVQAQSPSQGDGILDFNDTSTTTVNHNRPLTGIVNGTISTYAHAVVAGHFQNSLIAQPVGGPQSIAWTFDNANLIDHTYINGQDVYAYYAQGNRSLAGNQTVGQYQICGTSAAPFGLVTGYFGGNVYYVALYTVILTPAEVLQNAQYMSAAMAKRGVPTSTLLQWGVPNSGITIGTTTTTTQCQFAGHGDSLTAGPTANNVGYPQLLTLASTACPSWSITNAGQSFENMGRAGANGSLYALAKYQVDPLFWPQAPSNFDSIWGGTNDGDTSAEAALQAYINERHQLGWSTGVVTMVSRNGEDTFKNTYNTWIRANTANFLTELSTVIDVASDPNLGADGQFANATYFLAGGPHPTQHGIYNDEVPIFNEAINHFYGNRSFSAATTYTTGAAAPITITALSESTNTMSFTSAGFTAGQFSVGSRMVCTGMTPSGYNSAYPGWTIISNSGTVITAYNNTTGLTAGTVFGTCTGHKQQDVDAYMNLAGSGATPNMTLESALGLTGQLVAAVSVTNPNGWTLTPWSTETINGAASLFVPNNSQAYCYSVLVSAAAGGANLRCTIQPQALITSHTGATYGVQQTIVDTGTLAGGTLAVTFTNAFSAATAYICTVTDTTTPGNAVTITYTSASVVTFAGTGVDNLKYSCVGH